MRDSFIEGDPGALLCVEFYADEAADLPPRLAALEADLRAHGPRLPLRPRPRSADAGAHLGAARGGARPVDGDEGGRQVAVVRRGHRGAAGAAARLHRALPGHGARPRHHGRRLRPRVGGLPPRPAGDQPQDRGGRAAVRGAGQRRRRPRARIRRRALRRTRRRPGAQPVHPQDVRAGALRRLPDHQADLRSGRPVQSRQDRRRRADDRQPALRRRLRDAAARHPLRLRRVRRLRRRRRDVQRHRRLPQDDRGHDVPVVHGDARRAAHDARPRQRAAAGDGRPPRRGRAGRPRRLRDARPLPRVPRVQGRVPGRRRHGALQERVPRRLLAAARHQPRSAGARQRAGAGAARQRAGAALERRRTQRPRARARRAPRRHRPPAPAAGVSAPHAAGPRRRRRDRRRPRRCSSSTRSPTTTTPRLGVAALDVLAAAGAPAALARNGCCGRPQISKGLLGEARALAAGQRGAALRRRRGRASARLLRAELPLGRARGRAGAAARRGAPQGPASSPRPACCSRSTRPRGPRRCRSPPAPRACCCTGIATSGRWAWSRPPRRCSARIPGVDGRRTPRPAAAAWPARSATGAITTRCRRPSASGGCSRPCAGAADGTVVVAAGTSCRHQIHDFTGAEAVHPAVLLRSLLPEGSRT